MDHCRIKLDEEENKLVFVFHCRHGTSMHTHHMHVTCMSHAGIVKTHNLGYQETDTVQAVFDKDHCSNQLLLQAKSVPLHVVADVASVTVVRFL